MQAQFLCLKSMGSCNKVHYQPLGRRISLLPIVPPINGAVPHHNARTTMIILYTIERTSSVKKFELFEPRRIYINPFKNAP